MSGEKMTEVRERPILLKPLEVRGILDGRITQLRRVVKPQPPEGWFPLAVEMYHPAIEDDDGMMRAGKEIFGAYDEEWGVACPYGKPGDRLYNNPDERYDSIHEHNQIAERRGASSNTGIAKQRLHGGLGRTGILQNEVCGLRTKSEDGLVSAGGVSEPEGVLRDYAVPQQQADYEECSSSGLHGVSRDASNGVDAGSAPRRKSKEQPADKSLLGQPIRELRRQDGARKVCTRRGSPFGEIDKRRAVTSSVGSSDESVQPEARSQNSWHGTELDTGNRKEGSLLWVRESYWAHPANNWLYKAGSGRIHYDADLTDTQRAKLRAEGWKKKPSIHMPRWAARIHLEVTAVKVERVQDISDSDCFAEGLQAWVDENRGLATSGDSSARACFRKKWNADNGKDAWERNDFVWCINFVMLGKP